jgi:hypothetical protein
VVARENHDRVSKGWVKERRVVRAMGGGGVLGVKEKDGQDQGGAGV